MAEHPILFSGEMVRAILEKRKTQTRRVIKPQPNHLRWNPIVLNGYGGWEDEHGKPAKCPYGQPGDVLWVRETWGTEELPDGLDGIRFKADNHFQPIENTRAAADAWIEASYICGLTDHWKPSIFMPRWASRISLVIKDIRVERVQEIGIDDAIAEGVTENPHGMRSECRRWYEELWNDINAKRGYGWEVNPWVWVLEFEVQK